MKTASTKHQCTEENSGQQMLLSKTIFKKHVHNVSPLECMTTKLLVKDHIVSPFDEVYRNSFFPECYLCFQKGKEREEKEIARLLRH